MLSIDGARSELAITAWTNYGDIIRRYIVPHLGSKRLVDLSALDVKAWHATLLDHGRVDGGALAVASVQLAHRTCIAHSPTPCAGTSSQPTRRPERGCQEASARR